MIAMSSNIWCVLPVIPVSSPAYPPMILTLSRGWATSTRTESRARADGETGKGRHERDETERGEPGGHRDHVLLADARLQVPVRVSLLEYAGPG